MRSARAFSPGPIWAGGVGVASEKEGGGEGSRVWKARTSILCIVISLNFDIAWIRGNAHLITSRLQIPFILQ